MAEEEFPHGTERGYRRHLRLREVPVECVPCKRAHTEHEAAKKARRAAREAGEAPPQVVVFSDRQYSPHRPHRPKRERGEPSRVEHPAGGGAQVAHLEPVPDPPEPDPVPSPLEDAEANYRAVVEAFKSALPKEIAPLSRRRQDLIELIAALRAKESEVSLADAVTNISSRRRTQRHRA